jgi:hypothetical protein
MVMLLANPPPLVEAADLFVFAALSGYNDWG